MDKEKVRAQLGEAAAKSKVAMSEIKANFKADEGATGVRKITSMFVNLWKSGVAGKCALTVCALIVLFLMSRLFSGCGAGSGNLAGASDNSESKEVSSATSDNSESKEVSSPNGKEPSIKGLRLGMSYNEALEACNKLIAEKKGLEVKEEKDQIKIRRQDNWTTYCRAWIKGKEGTVYCIDFERLGIGLFFNSADLKGEEFGRLLLKNYSWIGSMEPEVKATLGMDGQPDGNTKTIWTYKSPNGYKVVLTAYELVDSLRIQTIKKEDSRKFD